VLLGPGWLPPAAVVVLAPLPAGLPDGLELALLEPLELLEDAGALLEDPALLLDVGALLRVGAALLLVAGALLLLGVLLLVGLLLVDRPGRLLPPVPALGSEPIGASEVALAVGLADAGRPALLDPACPGSTDGFFVDG